MRARDFLTTLSALTEDMMSQSNWMRLDDKSKEFKYIKNLIDGLKRNQPYSFEYKKERFTGIIQNPNKVISDLGADRKNFNIKKVSIDAKKILFNVRVIDDETGQLTDIIVNNVPLTAMFKDEKIKEEFTPNLGNIAEALLGCAVAAKFRKIDSDVTLSDLIAIGQELADNDGNLVTQAGEDTLNLKVSIPFMDKKIFYAWLGKDSRGKTLNDYKIPETSIATLAQRAKSAVEYANRSRRVKSAVEYVRSERDKNGISVISDGGEKEKQTTTKVDLRILIDGIEASKRLLSVKAGSVTQIGQNSGPNFSHIQNFFKTMGVTINISNKARNENFIEIAPRQEKSAEKKRFNFDYGFRLAYDDAFDQLSKKSRKDQKGLVEDIYQGLLEHLTKKEEGVEMVILDPDSKKAFRELSFGKEFNDALRLLKLAVYETSADSMHNISIYGFPIENTIAKDFVPSRKNADSRLVDLRSKFKDGTIRNTIEMGNLLKNIADIENYIEKTEDEPKEPQLSKPKVKNQPPVQKSATPIGPTPTQSAAGKPSTNQPSSVNKSVQPISTTKGYSSTNQNNQLRK